MAEQTYAKPPIVEAVIDIRTRFQEPADVLALRFKECHRLIADKFPTASPIFQIQFGFDTSAGEAGGMHSKVGQSEIGLRLSSAKNDRVLQLQQTGLTLSHMAPYSRWESFRSEVQQLWPQFVKSCSPQTVTRHAVRFINRISIPKVGIEVYDYFNLYPQLPKGIPNDTSGVLVKVQMPQSDLSLTAMAVVNLVLVEPEFPEHTTFILDIDLFSASDEIDPTSEEIWSTLDEFRVRKNQIFEACITDATRRLFT